MTRKNAETKRAARSAKKAKTIGSGAKSRSRSKSKRDASSPADAGASSEIGDFDGVSNMELDALWSKTDAAHEAAEPKSKKKRAKSGKRAKASPAASEAPKPTPESADVESSDAAVVSRPEVDPSKLKPEDLRKRVAKVYVLERQVERCRAAYDLSRRHFNGAKRALADAEEQLEQEIRDQRYGPGPLFSPDGKGAAAAPSPGQPEVSSAPVAGPAAGQDDGLSSVDNEFEAGGD